MGLEISRSLTIPAAELQWRFSRASGPGGQHVNTSDSRVELTWSVQGSAVLTDAQRERLLTRLAPRLIVGALTVRAKAHRSQRRNRDAALAKLAEIVRGALAADGPTRKPTKPTRGSRRRHLAAKTRRSATKQLRRRPAAE